MLLTLGAAGATLLVMLTVIAAPAVAACNGDSRGLVTCLRGLIDDRFELGTGAGATPGPALKPEAAEAPSAPSAADKPAPETPAIVAEPPPVAVAPVEPSGAPAEIEAPSFVPPAPVVEIGGVPPDLKAAAVAPPPASQAAPAVPKLPTTPPPATTDPVAPTEEPVPAPAVPQSLSPSIDAVESDGALSYFVGSGPAGATIRLYVDGIPVGVSRVEGGRWQVEGNNLPIDGLQTLKVEALDPVTGKLLGEATVEFEPMVKPPKAEQPAPIELRPSVMPETLTEPEAPPLPLIRPAVPAIESRAVTIPEAPVTDSFTELPTGEPADGSVLTSGAAASDDPGVGRFVAGKAIIRQGDTLWGIAHSYYGHGVHYRTIYRANRNLIGRPSKIYPGQVFELPLVSDD